MPPPSPLTWGYPSAPITHQQCQSNGHEHCTPCHPRQADEVKGPTSSSLHHEELSDRGDVFVSTIPAQGKALLFPLHPPSLGSMLHACP